MFPVLFRIGSFEVTSFGLMMFLSFLTGAWLLGRQLERYGLSREYAWDVLAWVAIGGILGAKLWYLGLHVEDLVADPVRELTSRGGLVWYGGLIGGVTAYYFQVRAKRLPMAVMYDGTAPALAAAYAVGRMGCFLVGDDYGRYTESWVGVSFPEGAPPTTAAQLRAWGSDIPAHIADSQIVTVHPTQLYEVALGLIMFVILWNVGKRSLRTGQLFSLFLVLYAIERFFIEFVRAKGDRFVAGLSTAQIASILLLGVGGWLWVHRGRVGAPVPTPANPPRVPRDAKPAGAAR
ncbi:MAG TPA: prolipoprotein diacylglyceryl transferase [Longimicrobiales bacterium]|nr:prolipoprotein diacylglyceryl transferase [Longimicrobiales bacterium]